MGSNLAGDSRLIAIWTIMDEKKLMIITVGNGSNAPERVAMVVPTRDTKTKVRAKLLSQDRRGFLVRSRMLTPMIRLLVVYTP